VAPRDITSCVKVKNTLGILSSNLRLGFPSGLPPSSFSTKTLYAPLFSHMQATCPAYLSILDLFTRIIIVEMKNHKASHDVVLTTPRLPRPTKAQISPSAPCGLGDESVVK
jgi:hypothetical protein